MPTLFRGSRRPLKLFTSVLIAGAALSVSGLSAPAGATTTDPNPTDPMSPGVYDTGTDPAAPNSGYTSSTDGTNEYTVVEQDANPDGSAAGPAVTVYDSGPVAATTTSTSPTSYPTPSTSGTGGSKSDSGCRSVTIAQDHNSVTGGNIYQYNEKTFWCWNRLNRKITSSNTSWWLSEMSFNASFVNTLWTRIGNYAWISGYNYSGYKHQRQAHIHVDGYGPIPPGEFYPTLQIWSHSNGTYGWEHDA